MRGRNHDHSQHPAYVIPAHTEQTYEMLKKFQVLLQSELAITPLPPLKVEPTAPITHCVEVIEHVRKGRQTLTVV